MDSDRDDSIPSPPPKRSVEKGSVFWKELYWFVIVMITGASLALWVLPSRIHRHRGLVELQSELRQRNSELERQERVHEAAIDAMRHDEFYRQAVWRQVLGVKKNTEEFLDAEARLAQSPARPETRDEERISAQVDGSSDR